MAAISYTYSTGEATSSYGHDIEYRFDWGDGNYSTWSSLTSASHSWSNERTYAVRAQARSATNTDVLSDWSEGFTVKITAETVLAKIDSYNPADSIEVEVGESVTLSLTLTNTGNTDWTFYAAASLRKPDGSEINLLPKPVTLSPGDQGNATWSCTIDQEGSWDLVFGIWKEEEQASSLGHTGWINNCIVGEAPEALPAIGSSPAGLFFAAVEGQANPSSQTLDIWNSGGGTLNWGVSSDVTWLLLSPASGSSSGETDDVRVSVDISGMDAGDYRGTMTIHSTGATSTSRVISVSLSISCQPVAPPDLTVPLVEAPSEGIAGQSISVTFVVENRGDDASGPFHNFVALSPKSKPWGTNVFLADVITDSILPDDSKRVTVDVTIPPSVSSPGDYHVTVYADAFEKVRESNEGNNIGSTYPQTIAVTSETPTIADLITSLATGGVPVTVDGELYVILTLRNRIDPIKLEAVPNSGTTKVYVYGDRNCPVSNPEVVRKIGLIDFVRQSVQGMRQELTQGTVGVKTDLKIADNIDFFEDFSERHLKYIHMVSDALKEKFLKLITRLGVEVETTILDPMERLKQEASTDLNTALAEYNRAIALSEPNTEITDYEVAHEFLMNYLWGNAHRSLGVSLLKGIYSKYESAWEIIEYWISKAVFGTWFELAEVFPKIEEAAKLTWDRTTEFNALKTDIDFQLSAKLFEAAPYTLELANSPRINFEVHSPVEIRLYDSQGQVTGIVNGKERTEIPYSVYAENAITIFLPNDSYRLEISGTGEGSYDVSVTRVAGQEVNKFTAAKIPVSLKATHQVAINWDTFSQEEDKLPIQVDSDGDGIVEEDKTEYLSVVGKEEGLPAWIWFAIGLVVGLIASLLAWRRMAWMKRGEIQSNSGESVEP